MKIKISFANLLENATLFLKKYRYWVLAGIFVLLLLANASIYYKFVYQVTHLELDISVDRVLINHEDMEQALGEIEAREQTLERIKSHQYIDPFND